MAIFKGRVRVRYGYSRWGYTRNNGKGWHGGSDEEGLDSTTIRMPDYKGKSISGRVVTARKVDRSTGSKTWEWGWYVCVELGAGDMAKSIYDPGNEQQPLLPRNGDGSNVTASFTEAEQDADIQTGEELTVLFGKIKKRFSTYDADGDGVVDRAATVPWDGITGKPGTFPPSTHNHDDRYYTETEMNTKLNGKANSSHTHSKDQVGLGNVDNTADANKTVLEANRLKVRTTSGLVVTGGSGLYYYPANAQDLPPNNQDGILLHITYGAWGGQLAFPTGGGVYYRYGTTTFSAWKRLNS